MFIYYYYYYKIQIGLPVLLMSLILRRIFGMGLLALMFMPNPLSTFFKITPPNNAKEQSHLELVSLRAFNTNLQIRIESPYPVDLLTVSSSFVKPILQCFTYIHTRCCCLYLAQRRINFTIIGEVAVSLFSLWVIEIFSSSMQVSMSEPTF